MLGAGGAAEPQLLVTSMMPPVLTTVPTERPTFVVVVVIAGPGGHAVRSKASRLTPTPYRVLRGTLMTSSGEWDDLNSVLARLASHVAVTE